MRDHAARYLVYLSSVKQVESQKYTTIVGVIIPEPGLGGDRVYDPNSVISNSEHKRNDVYEILNMSAVMRSLAKPEP